MEKYKIVEEIKHDLFSVVDIGIGKKNVMRKIFMEEAEKEGFEKMMKDLKELVEDGVLLCEYIEHFYEGKNM